MSADDHVASAKDLMRRSLVVEGHRDCYEQIHWLNMGEPNPVRDRLSPRLRTGGIDLVVYAIGGDTLAHSNGRDKKLLATLENISELRRMCEEDGTNMQIVRSADEVPKDPDGTLRFLLHLEGGSPLEGSLAALETLYALGVRSIQPTWNVRNELGDGVHERGTGGGLTRFGVAVLKVMNELGMLIDLAHIAEAGFWQTLREVDAPVVVSHANAREVYDHPRNISDEQVTAIADRGGVVGIHTLPTFIGPDNPSVDDLVHHIEHFCEVAGADHVAVGADFVKEDGPRPGKEALFHDPRKEPPVVPGLSEADEMPNLAAALLQRGWSEEDVSLVLGGNSLRVIRQTLRG